MLGNLTTFKKLSNLIPTVAIQPANLKTTWHRMLLSQLSKNNLVWGRAEGIGMLQTLHPRRGAEWCGCIVFGYRPCTPLGCPKTTFALLHFSFGLQYECIGVMFILFGEYNFL